MQTKTPCTDYIETKGLIYFARMLDKIRLKAAGELPPEYFTGVEDPTHFDARCTRFLGVNYDELVERTLKGGSDDEILEWCFARGRRPNDEEISIWNAFLRKRGWRDEASEELAESKKEAGFGDRDDIQTWMDLHDAEEGRTTTSAVSYRRKRMICRIGQSGVLFIVFGQSMKLRSIYWLSILQFALTCALAVNHQLPRAMGRTISTSL